MIQTYDLISGIEDGDIVKHLTYDLIREISLKHQHSVCGLFEQGSGQRELGEAAALHPWL
jgi:hypothetical protein